MEAQKQEFLIKDLPTKSVTLYPSRAHIVRDIDDVSLKPGQNEIEIYGLSPTVDEQSVQIDGKGAATITDITVELVPNREIFEELYPEADEEKVDEEDPIELEDCDEVKLLKSEIEKLEVESKACEETINSAARQLETLNSYSNSLKADKNGAQDVIETIEMYEQQRNKIFHTHCDATEKLKKAEKSITEKKKQKTKAGVEDRKRFDERVQAKNKETRRKEAQRRERQNQANRIREERLKFFPKKVYKVTVNLETPLNIDTPATSRRGSLDSITLAPSEAPNTTGKAAASVSSDFTSVSLSLSYNTRDASWSPRYDISVSSVQKSASIAYRAELVNGTSETWKDTKLILSTSQTSYGGLEDKVPILHPWHVKLSKTYDQGLLSPEEINHPRGGQAHVAVPPRNELFGSSQDVFTWGSKKQQMTQKQRAMLQQQAPQQAQMSSHHPMMFSSHGHGGPPPQAAAPAASSSLFGGASRSNGAFGANTSNPFPQHPANQSGGLFGHASFSQPAQAPLFGSSVDHTANSSAVTGFGSNHGASAYAGSSHDGPDTSRARKFSRRRREAASHGDDDDDEDEEDAKEGGLDSMSSPAGPTVGYQEASWEDDGLTSTYEVPGARTLAPSSLARRHKIASLMASNIHLSHVAVPKLLASAFLRAKIRNPSSTVTLLKGTAGVTLDSSFLGNMDLSRVSPGQVFDLPLGIDPAVSINYPKPSVHRSTQGIFSKESAQVFSRNAWITNSKNMTVEILILDQVPISEDERLSIGIIEPRGLGKEGDVVRAGKAAKEAASGAVETAKTATPWGKATAALKKDGQVAWTVYVEKKQACLLKLEYETRMPAAEKIMPAE